MPTAVQKLMGLNPANKSMAMQLIEAIAQAQANTDRANSCANNERTEEKKEEKK